MKDGDSIKEADSFGKEIKEKDLFCQKCFSRADIVYFKVKPKREILALLCNYCLETYEQEIRNNPLLFAIADSYKRYVTGKGINE